MCTVSHRTSCFQQRFIWFGLAILSWDLILLPSAVHDTLNQEGHNNINNSKNESKEKENALSSAFSLQYHACVPHCLLPLVFCLWECNVNHKDTAFQLSNSCSPPFSISTKGYPPQFVYEKMSSSNIYLIRGRSEVGVQFLAGSDYTCLRWG